jgi:MoaA/NifB/PqqE/SkfB family radical SAM enzyme
MNQQTELMIEPTLSCQLKCPSCPSAAVKNPHGSTKVIGGGSLKVGYLRALLDGAPHLESISLSCRGELFLNRDLPQIIDLASERGMPISCYSGANLNNVSDEAIAAMVGGGFVWLNCAIDGATQETYAIYRRGGNLESALETVRRINCIKRALGSEYPRLVWQYVVFGHNEHEMSAAREIAESLDMIFVPKMAWDSTYSPIRDRDLVARETGWKYLTREEHFAATGLDYMRLICYPLWRSPRINWNGDVLGCCWNDWQTFGTNAFVDGYDAAIACESLNVAREMLMGRAAPDRGVPCASCHFYKAIVRTGNYITEKEALGIRSLPYKALRYVYDRAPALQRLRRIVYEKTGR